MNIDGLSETQLIELEKKIAEKKIELKDMKIDLPKEIIDEYNDLCEMKEFSKEITITVDYYWETPELLANYNWEVSINGVGVNPYAGGTNGDLIEKIVPDFLKNKDAHDTLCEKFREKLDKYGAQENVINALEELRNGF